MIGSLAKGAVGVAGLAEAMVRAGLLVVVTCLGGQAERGGVLEAGMDRLADGEQHLAEAVQRVGFTGRVPRSRYRASASCRCPAASSGWPCRRYTSPILASVSASASRMPISTAHGQGLVQLAGGLPVAALPQADDAEVDQRAGLDLGGADLRADGEGLPLVTGGQIVTALPLLADAKAVQGVRLVGQVAGLIGIWPGPAGDGRWPPGSGPDRVDLAEVAQRPGLPGAVVGLPEQSQGLPEVADGLLVVALPPVDAGQVVQRGRLGGRITYPLGRGAGVAVDGDGLGVVAALSR